MSAMTRRRLPQARQRSTSWPKRFAETVLFVNDEAFAHTSASGRHLWRSIPLGHSEVSQMVPAGDYVLMVRLPGGRERRRSIHIGPGETVPAYFEF